MSLPQITKQMQFLRNGSENADPNVQNYHKLMKMKKLLIDTETKMFNRIKLFQKASQKVLKKKENQIKVFQKLQTIKNDPIFSRARIRPKTRQDFHRSQQRSETRQYNLKNTRSNQNLFDFLIPNRRQSFFQENHSPRKVLAQRLNETRMHNAKLIKEDRQRNKVIIQQRKKKEMTRKLQSANIIRRQRQKVKMVKEQCMKERQQDFKKCMGEKYEKQKEEFIKLQMHLQQLQEQEKQALITWKRTVQN